MNIHEFNNDYLNKNLDKLFKENKTILLHSDFNPIQNGPFWGCSQVWGAKKTPLPKICYTYPTMMKPGTVTPYLKKTQRKYESRDTPLESC